MMYLYYFPPLPMVKSDFVPTWQQLHDVIMAMIDDAEAPNGFMIESIIDDNVLNYFMESYNGPEEESRAEEIEQISSTSGVCNH